jgi:hypothetical protein
MVLPQSQIYQADANGLIQSAGQGGGVAFSIEPATISSAVVGYNSKANIPGRFPLYVYFDNDPSQKQWVMGPGLINVASSGPGGAQQNSFFELSIQGAPRAYYKVTVFQDARQGHIAFPPPSCKTLLNIPNHPNSFSSGTTHRWVWGEGTTTDGMDENDANIGNVHFWDVREYLGVGLELYLNYTGSASNIDWRILMVLEDGPVMAVNQFLSGFDYAGANKVSLASAGSVSGGLFVHALLPTGSTSPYGTLRLAKPSWVALLATPTVNLTGTPLTSVNFYAFR